MADASPTRLPLIRSVSEQHQPHHKPQDTNRASLPTDVHAPSPASPMRLTSLRHTFAFGQMPVLARELSLLLRRPSTSHELIRCHICYDDVDIRETIPLTVCGHRFCVDCLTPYLELKIQEGNVYPVCFHPMESTTAESHQEACGAGIEIDQIEKLVASASFEKLQRFRFNKEHDRARECPYCAHIDEYPGPETPHCICTQCRQSFCYLHGNAHPQGSCANYELQNAATEALNRTKIKEISKPCPGCNRNVEKNGGCNHMRCIGCDTHFCWLCGQMIEGGIAPAHYDASSGSPCSGRQFDSVQTSEEQLSMRIFVTLALVVCALPAIILGLILTPFVMLFKSGTHTFGDVLEEVISCIAAVIATPLAIVYFPLAALVTILWRGLVLLFESVKSRVCRRQQDPVVEEVPLPEPTDLERGNALVETPREENRYVAL